MIQENYAGKDGIASKLNEGQTLRVRISDVRSDKNPLARLGHYYIHIKPKSKSPDYIEKFNLLRQGEIIDVIIDRIQLGRNGIWHCDASYLDIEKQRRIESVRQQNVRASMSREYVSPEHELQAKFGNTIPSDDEIESIQRKWRTQDRKWGMA
jgi:hypothetical protein